LDKARRGEAAPDVALVPFESDVGVPDLRGILEPFAGVMFVLAGENGRAMGWGEPFDATKGEVRRFLLALVGVARPGLPDRDLAGMERGICGLALVSISGRYIFTHPLRVLTGQSKKEGRGGERRRKGL